jgi:hypothetical protein
MRVEKAYPFLLQEQSMTRGLLLFSILSLAATAAMAQIGPPTSQRTCSANRQLVLKEGAVVLDTARNALSTSFRSRRGFQAPTTRNASSATDAGTGPTISDGASMRRRPQMRFRGQRFRMAVRIL